MAQHTASDNLKTAIARALAEAPAAEVLPILTEAFLSLTVDVLRGQGLDVNRKIELDGAERNITIHAPKA